MQITQHKSIQGHICKQTDIFPNTCKQRNKFVFDIVNLLKKAKYPKIYKGKKWDVRETTVHFERGLPLSLLDLDEKFLGP